uniref:Otogelin n=1 Tax=Naja naja TaxID=35670 RepID=A0A8C6Y166_NAJNA
CVHWKMCNCSRYNATGSRCQIVHNMGTERDNICRTWGQYHYETFDGLYYFFSGKSTYVLVRQSELDEQSFSIQIHNDPECSSFPYSCKRSVSLYFSGEEEIRLSNEVTYKGIGIQLPYTIGKLHIQKVAGYVIVRHQYAFSLAWDGVSAVYIKMAPDYLGKTHGLCGNNNAILQDELSTSYGETYILCSVLLWSPFKECHDFVSPFPFMASCTNDLCIDNTTWCRALTEYARTCAQAGRPLHEWRAHFEQCVVKCEEHLVYNECIDCCPFSCRQKTHCVDSELPCVDGCYCPDGLIYEDRLCVRPIDCPCDYHGTIHRTGAHIGKKILFFHSLLPAQCSVSGDIHFMTFDGRKFTFQAPCQYILAKSRVSDKFAVTLQNAPCGQNHDGTCIQSISLIFSQDFRRQVTLTHSGDVLVHDQYKVNLPYIDDSFEIRKLSSVFLQIKSYIGLQILYDWKGLRLYLEADAQWKDDTIGLCGTFNGNTQDDFLSPVGVPETTPQLFGNSWKISSSCSPGYDSSSIDPCDIHLQAAAYATEACSIITKELFAPCYTYLSPLPYFEQCRRDTCKCGQICMCSALSHYAHLCHRFGVEINFRRSVPECALSCEDTKEYSTCVSTCGRSCRAFSMPEACDGDCVEGCTCPSGMYLNIKTDRCVPQYVVLDHNCPEGQIYVNCSNPPTMELGRERTCENQLLNITMSAQLPCFSGCMCPTGLSFLFDIVPVINLPCFSICSHGSFKCNFHPCPSMCTTYGDRHYRTFDGLSFDYVGNCKVYLVKVRLYFKQVYIWKAGFFTIVHFPNEHITVMWDQRTTVHVETGPQWQGELTGLCGNFDAKTINEMRTPENFELTNAQEFGSTWAAVEVNSDIRHPCILNPLRETFAKKECGILLSEIFESCHPVVDVTWFYSNCLIDTCGCNQGGDCECFCTSVSAYAHQCCQQGVTVDWRSPRLCLLGKGPYKLVSYLDGETIIAAKLQDGSVFPAREDDLASGNALTFMLTSPLYKPKAHGKSNPHLVSLEAADRPNYFLYLASNNTLVLSKWERNEHFQNRSTFAIHKNTWFSGYSSFESFAIQGMFIHISASSVTVVKYHHSEAFRFSTLFKLVESKFKFLSRSTCEWRYDACSSPCFKTCRDPLAKHCQTVPKVEGCVPMCPLNLVLDELTQRCVYFEDCTYNVILIQNYSYYCRFQFKNDCIKHICLDGQLIQVNQSQYCPYSATQPSCGILGFAVQINGDKCCPKWECACRCTFFSDLSFITFDGHHVALFKEASYIISQTQDEIISIHVVDNRNSNMVLNLVYYFVFIEYTLKYIGEPRTHEANCSAMNCSFCLNTLLSQTFSSCHPYTLSTLQHYVNTVLLVLLAFPCPEGFTYKACIYPCLTPSTCQSTASTVEDSDSCLVLTEGCTCAEGTVLHQIHSALCIPEEKCACTDHSGVPHAVGEIWKTSSSDCCMHKCVDSDTITAVEYNCSVNYDVRCQRFGEVALIVPDDQSCCHQKVCMCSFCFINDVYEHLSILFVSLSFLEIAILFKACEQFYIMLFIFIEIFPAKDKVCLNNERGVLLPGQSIVEHSSGGICHTSYCTSILDPVTKFYQMNTSIIDCAARCKSVRSSKLNYNWTLNCLKYDCINTPVGSVLITSPISCPPFNETECVKVRYIVPFLEGCCKTCKEDGKFCKKVTVRMTIRKNDCRSNTPVNIVSCDGKCPSASIYNYNINTYARFCKCCRELGLHRRTVQLYCSGNSTWVSYTIQEPTDCSCQWS